MNMYLVKRQDLCSYDEYDSFVVIAENETEARNTHPSPYRESWNGKAKMYDSWVNADDVIVEKIGYSDETKTRVVCASFNSG